MDDSSSMEAVLTQEQPIGKNAITRHPKKFASADATYTYSGHRTKFQATTVPVSSDEDILQLVPAYQYKVADHKDYLFINAKIVHAFACPAKPQSLTNKDFEFIGINDKNDMKITKNQQRAMRRKKFLISFKYLRQLIAKTAKFNKFKKVIIVDPADKEDGAVAKHWESDDEDLTDREEVPPSQGFDLAVLTAPPTAPGATNDDDDPLMISHGKTLDWPGAVVHKYTNLGSFWANYFKDNEIPVNDLDARSFSVQVGHLNLVIAEARKRMEHFYSKAYEIWRQWDEAEKADKLTESFFNAREAKFDEFVLGRNNAYFAELWASDRISQITEIYNNSNNDSGANSTTKTKSVAHLTGRASAKRVKLDTHSLGKPRKQRFRNKELISAQQETRAQVCLPFLCKFMFSLYLLSICC